MCHDLNHSALQLESRAKAAVGSTGPSPPAPHPSRPAPQLTNDNRAEEDLAELRALASDLKVSVDLYSAYLERLQAAN